MKSKLFVFCVNVFKLLSVKFFFLRLTSLDYRLKKYFNFDASEYFKITVNYSKLLNIPFNFQPISAAV